MWFSLIFTFSINFDKISSKAEVLEEIQSLKGKIENC